MREALSLKDNQGHQGTQSRSTHGPDHRAHGTAGQERTNHHKDHPQDLLGVFNAGNGQHPPGTFKARKGHYPGEFQQGGNGQDRSTEPDSRHIRTWVTCPPAKGTGQSPDPNQESQDP